MQNLMNLAIHPKCVGVAESPFPARHYFSCYFVCSLEGPIEIILPTGRKTGALILIKDIGAAAINNITVKPQPGETIEGLETPQIIDVNRYAMTLITDDRGGWWRLS